MVFLLGVQFWTRLLTCPLLCSVLTRWSKSLLFTSMGRRGSLFTSSSLVSRASVTCLLGVEQGIHVFFTGVNGVGDVLAGRGAGC